MDVTLDRENVRDALAAAAGEIAHGELPVQIEARLPMVCSKARKIYRGRL